MNSPATPLEQTLQSISAYIKALRNWLSTSKENRIVFILSIAFMLLLGFLSWFNLNSQYIQQKNLVDTYSNTLTHMSADQLKVSMGSNNLIGLQATLNKLLEQPKVINAIVHNVDNKVIVQAGESTPLDSNTYRSVTAPISLDSNLLGSLTININDTLTINNSLTFFILFVFISTLFFLIYKITKSDFKDIIENNVSNKPASIEEKDTISATVIKHKVFLLIHCHTIEKLHQQLTSDAKLKELKEFDTILDKILKLYSGDKTGITTNTILVCFDSVTNRDSLLNSLCSAYLLNQYGIKENWLLKISCYIYDTKSNVISTELNDLKLANNSHGRDGIFLKQQTIHQNNLQDIVNCKNTDGTDYLHLSNFNGSYAGLLNNQLKHI